MNRINKKVCSGLYRGAALLVIAAFVLIGAPVVSYAEDKYTDYRYEGLYQLGIIPDGYKADDKILTRGECASMIARIYGYGSNIDGENIYSDIEDEYFAAKEIAYVSMMGIFNGYGDGTFRSEQAMTYPEFAAVIVKALGYDSAAQNLGGFPDGYTVLLSKIKADSIGNISGNISRKAALDYIYKFLDTELLQPEYTEGKLIYKSSGETPMEKWMKLDRVDGIVTAIGDMSVIHDNVSGAFLTIGSVKASIKKEIDYDKFLGYYCEAYVCSKNSDSPGKLKAISVMTDENNITVIKTNEVISYSNGCLEYESKDKIRQITIPSSADVVKNGTPVKAQDRAAALTKSDGTITINRPNAGDIKMIVLIENYDTYVVGGIDTERRVIYDRVKSGAELKLEDDGNKVIITGNDGMPMDFNGILAGDVLSVKSNYDASVIRVICTRQIISGKIEEIEYTQGDGDAYIIDGQKLKTTANYRNFKTTKPSVGDGVSIYLDTFGRAADIIFASSQGYKYGYLCEAEADEADKNNCLLNIYCSDGKFQIFSTAKNISVDNEKAKDANAVISLLKRGTKSDSVYQIIRYKTDQSERISKIDTLYMSSYEDKNTLRALYTGYTDAFAEKEKLVYKAEGNTFQHKVIVGANTKMMTAAKSYDGNEDIFKMGKGLKSDEKVTINAYVSSTGQVAPDLILFYSNSSSQVSDYTYGIIRKIVKTVNEYDETVFGITACTLAGDEYFYQTTEDYKLDSIYSVDDTKNTQGNESHSLKPGDFVRMGLNSLNKVVCVDLIYDVQAREWKSSSNPWGDFYVKDFCFGTAYKLDGSYLQLALPESDLEKVSAEQLRTFNIGSASVFWCSRDGKVIKKITSSAILPYYTIGIEASNVLVYSDHGRPVRVFIYE